MTTITAEDSDHLACLRTDGSVAVYRKGAPLFASLLGVGRWENGTILGSGVNCGILVRLETELRSKTGTK